MRVLPMANPSVSLRVCMSVRLCVTHWYYIPSGFLPLGKPIILFFSKPKWRYPLSRVSTHNTQSAILLYQFRAVRLSVRHIVVLYPNECTYRQTLRPFSTDITLIFHPNRPYQISSGTISVGVKCAGWRISTEIAVLLFCSETTQDMPIVNLDHQQKVIGSRTIRVGSDDLE